jgi:carboxypeptidase Q
MYIFGKKTMLRIIPFVYGFAILIVTISSDPGQNYINRVDEIYQNALNSFDSHENLRFLCTETAGRLPGTRESEKAINFVFETLKKYKADSVWLLPVQCPGWRELKPSVCEIVTDTAKKISLSTIALGQSISSPENGIKAPVVIINSREQIDSLGEKGLKGKIAFFNGRMEKRSDYGKWAWSRVEGASMVSKYGAVGVLVRSLTTRKDDNPHTGVVRYDQNYPKIPAVALSWIAADTLESYLEKDPGLLVNLQTYCENPGLIDSYNVIGEIRGSLYPEQILLLTAHLDTWHNTQGAHDNSGGVVQIMDVIRLLKELCIKPKRTIRVMAYMDEEQYLTGMQQYADYYKNRQEVHLLDIEVDYGIGVPKGFHIQADSLSFVKQEEWREILANYSLDDIRFSNTPAKWWPLYAKDKTTLAHLYCQDDNYFDYHHSSNDVFETVDKGNLQRGSAALASFIYLIDQMDALQLK